MGGDGSRGVSIPIHLTPFCLNAVAAEDGQIKSVLGIVLQFVAVGSAPRQRGDPLAEIKGR